MLLYIGMVAFLSFAVTIGVVAVKAGKMARETAKEEITQIAFRYCGVVKAEMEVAMDATRTLAQTFEGLKKSGQMPKREVLDQVMQQILDNTPGLLAV